jgi:ribosomal protein L11 methyltransferase
MEMYYYLESRIPLELEDQVDACAHGEYQCTGIEEFSIEEAKVDEILGERSYSGGDVPESVINEVESTLKNEGIDKKYYFTTVEDAKIFLSHLKQNFSISSKVVSMEVKDWDEEWKKSYAPILVGSELEVVPEWQKDSYVSNSQNKLFIYPGRGFGTGSHETTFLCLKHLLNLVSDKVEMKSCLDFGCGSGILGIAFKMFFNVGPIDLYDIDSEALENSVQNIELNKYNVKDFALILPKEREVINRKYSLVFANILQNVLLLESEYLASCLEDDGHLILSGLLAGQEKEVIDAIQSHNPNLKYIETLAKGDWVAVLMGN